MGCAEAEQPWRIRTPANFNHKDISSLEVPPELDRQLASRLVMCERKNMATLSKHWHARRPLSISVGCHQQCHEQACCDAAAQEEIKHDIMLKRCRRGRVHAFRAMAGRFAAA
eukprot:354988-Chlamydomonas_euryale.AAC.18